MIGPLGSGDPKRRGVGSARPSAARGEQPKDDAPEKDVPPSLKVTPTVYPTSPPIREEFDRFYEAGPELSEVTVDVRLPETPLHLLERLGPSPFPRGGFPLIGFLATTYDKVSRYALERAEEAGCRGEERGEED